jgi:hypothetical protein
MTHRYGVPGRTVSRAELSGMNTGGVENCNECATKIVGQGRNP